MSPIKYLKHSEIDLVKWDDRIRDSQNGIIYAYSWYLDIVCKNWGALTEGNYETVMPLTAGKKLGINYLYPPYGTQQLGVFSKEKLSEQKVKDFLDAIPALYKYIEINLNTAHPPLLWRGVRGEVKLTHELSLNNPYETLHQHFSENTKRNLKKANKHGLQILKNIAPVEVIKMFRENRGKQLDKLTDKHYGILKKLINECIKRKCGKVWGVADANNKLCAGAFFVESNNKIIFLFSGANEKAKENAALPFLIDRCVSEHAGSGKILDFEGSNDPGLARFYKGFGSAECVYLQVKKNNLPKLIKWIKK